MARLDPATQKFAAELKGEDKHSPLEQPLRAAKAAVRFVENPQKSITRAIVRAAMEKSGHMSPLKIFSTLNEHYGQAWWDWEPETIWTTLATEQGLHADDELKNIVGALQTALATNYPFEHWHVFEKTGQAFNLNTVDFSTVQPLEPNEVSLTIYILKTIRPKEEFADEVKGYIAACATEAGLTFLPAELFSSGAQDELEKMVPDHSGVGKSTRAAWGIGTETGGSSELPVLHQLKMLREIKDYVKTRL